MTMFDTASKAGRYLDCFESHLRPQWRLRPLQLHRLPMLRLQLLPKQQTIHSRCGLPHKPP